MSPEAGEKLLRPLRLELKQGCKDRAIQGGLQAYLDRWAKPESVGPALARSLRSLAAAYAGDNAVQRKVALTAVIEELQVAPQGEATPTPISSPSAPPARPLKVALNPASSVSALPGLGPKRMPAFKSLGILSIEDLLHHYPRSWQDRSHFLPISKIRPGELVTVLGTVRGASTFRTRNRLTITEVAVQDASGLLFVYYYNQPFRQRQFLSGSQVVLSGRAEQRGAKLQMSNAEAEMLPQDEEQLIHTGRVVPLYPSVKELSQRVLRSAVWRAMEAAPEVEDAIPSSVSKRLGFSPLEGALRQIHFPSDETMRLKARERLVFEEFFVVGLGMAMRKQSRKKEAAAKFGPPAELLERFEASLPFSLTKAQAKVWREIQSDLGRREPMQRLIQGDVGSGKTMVAALAIALAVQNGYQAAMMAPTEILADQHLANLRRWFEPLGVHVLPLKQSQSAAGKREVLEHLVSGRPLIAVGTQALIQEGVEFGNLGLAVVDEQHRFGVLQRLSLAKKAKIRPHVLVMTATPIPRTLAMTAYGDLDVSVIDELPPGRSPVKTMKYHPKERELAYEAVRRELKAGRQAYIVYALVEEGEKAEKRAATQMAGHLQRDIFPRARVGLLHGRMKTEEKESVMNRFKAGELDILCSTTVVEVGVDVPNATLMMIEDADHFGLAQLHQLRGRVGRGAAQSYCYLIADPKTPEGIERIDAMIRTSDGFKIAEEDLRLRGPGEILGIRQSGLPDFKLANLVSDQALLIQAKAEAEGLIKADPELKEPGNKNLRMLLKRRIERKLELGEVG